jgi:hypothetical protein
MTKILKSEHPRLFINNQRIIEMKGLEKNDVFFQKLKEGLLKTANRLMGVKPVDFKITGPRMLKNCQEIHFRVSILSLSYLLTDDKKFAMRAKDELLSAAGYPHWNKDHFLDTAELITAFAIGYDWLYHALPKLDLEIIKKTMIEKGIRVGLTEHKNNIWWAGHKYNWNQVCNGGMIIGALAIGDEEPQILKEVFDATVKYLPIAFNSYGKDGGWEGGPEYWQYTTWYSVLLVDVLQNITGDDFGLSKTPGFNKTGLFPIYSAGPNDKYFNFADADEDYNALQVLYWLGEKFKIESCISENKRLLQKALSENTETDAFNLVWYVPSSKSENSLPVNRLFGDIHSGYMRTEWGNTKSAFVAFKGGYNQADHAHLDLGSFVLDLNGVRWVSELGRDNYDLPNYFDLSEGGGRWKYFRLNTKSHNTLVLNNDNQRAMAVAEITNFSTENGASVGEIDLSKAYTPHANSVKRTIKLINKAEVIVSDKIDWTGSSKLAQWQILTDAEIVLSGKKATLKKDGQEIFVTILNSDESVFEVISAEQEEPENKNKGFKQLVIKKTEVGKVTEFSVSFSTNK